MPAHVRRADLADAEKLARFQLLMAKETEGKNLDESIVLPAVKSVFDDPQKGFYVVTEIDGQVIAGLMITFEWSDWRNTNLWYIQSVYVDSNCRGQGVFKQMYRFVTAAAKAVGVKHVRLYVETGNQRAQKVYESLGMKKMPYFMYDAEI